jgi:hypothetical protein
MGGVMAVKLLSHRGTPIVAKAKYHHVGKQGAGGLSSRDNADLDVYYCSILW